MSEKTGIPLLDDPPKPGEIALAVLKQQLSDIYGERQHCVALAAFLAVQAGWPTWLGKHQEVTSEEPSSWEPDWMNVVYIQTPAGQVSWHIHDSELSLFPSLEFKDTPWDGHETIEKYDRIRQAIGLESSLTRKAG